MATIQQLRTPHLDIAFETAGPQDGTPVVLVHGWPADIRCWDQVKPQLVEVGCRVSASYLRGCGPTRFLSADKMRGGAIAALGQDFVEGSSPGWRFTEEEFRTSAALLGQSGLGPNQHPCL